MSREEQMPRVRKIAPELRNLRLRHLESQLHGLQSLRSLPQPRRGWVRTIREALGMEGKQLARRVGLSPSAITMIEKREATGLVTLARLKEVADALDADLVYALIPRTSLASQRTQQAHHRAEQIVKTADQTMALEAQAISPKASEHQRAEIADRLLREWSSDLWSDNGGE